MLMAGAGVLALGSGSASAYTLTFDGDICTASPCTNFSLIQQSYGDVAGVVDVKYNYDINNPGTTTGAAGSEMSFWTTDYNDLVNVAYSSTGGIPTIFLQPLAGQAVTLNGLDLGAWPNRTGLSQLTIVDGLNNVLFTTGGGPFSEPVGVGSTTHNHYSFLLTSLTGIGIQFGPESYNVGIDNVDFTVGVNPVPLPAALPLFASAVALFGVYARRRKQKVALA